MTKSDIVKVVKLNDAHVPFEDAIAVNAALAFCERMQPDIIITDEWMDFYELSRFVKDPTKATGYTLHEARMTVWKWYKRIAKVCPSARRIELNANHPKRLKKYLQSNAGELCGLPEFEMDNFMEYSKRGVEHMNYFMFRGVLFKHGDVIRKHSAYTAKGELEREGMSGMSGHSHRMGQHYKTLRGGEFTWVECGCLCDLNQEYMEDKVADWQHGLGLATFWDDRYRLMPLPIIDGKIDWL